MPDPAQGRANAGGHSPRLASRDPRIRTNAAGQVGDRDLDPATLESVDGQTRVRMFDGMAPLAANASLGDIVARLNAMLARGQGQA